MWLRMTLNYESFCFHLPMLGIEACTTCMVYVVLEMEPRALWHVRQLLYQWSYILILNLFIITFET